MERDADNNIQGDTNNTMDRPPHGKISGNKVSPMESTWEPNKELRNTSHKDTIKDPLMQLEMTPIGAWAAKKKECDEMETATTYEWKRKKLLKVAIIAILLLIALLLITVPTAVMLANKKDSEPVKTTKTTTTSLKNATTTVTINVSTPTTRPTSQPVITCTRLIYSLANGRLICNGSSIGDSCIVACDAGYIINNGTGFHVCARSSAGSASWTGRQGSCHRIPCAGPPSSTSINIQRWICTDGYAIGSTCSLACLKNGYQTNNPTSTCLPDRKWSNAWTECTALNPCTMGMHNCSEYAVCANNAPGAFTCSCKVGYAGDGNRCTVDTDLDGSPDNQLNCSSKHCIKDNCLSVPNSGQEDFDADGTGDACDDDDDNDGFADKEDNCSLASNTLQNDTDSDGVGDVCDNCRYANNTDQLDSNRNGIGDECEPDADSDGVNNTIDNCPKFYNPNQRDTDADGVGDACDNCQSMRNPLQEDKNYNLIGDLCEHEKDTDFDGITDNIDNCISIPNGNQVDTNNDSIGDACDDDRDGDSVKNVVDNCPLVPNKDQVDRNNNDVGDRCENDDDGDGIVNDKDDFPLNANMNQTDFRNHDKIVFDDEGTEQPAPIWFLYDQGKEILQTVNGNPGALIGRTYFGRLEFSGTLMVRSPEYGKRPDDDYVGIIFGFQSNRNFYVCSWKKISQSYSVSKSVPYPRAYGRKGISLKRFRSATGPGQNMRDALWETGNAINQSTLLWHDKEPAWNFNVSYQWNLIHDPDSGRIRIRWYEGRNQISDSGDIIDKTWRGGRVGVFVFSQENVYFSAMKTRIPTVKDYALELDGEKSYINIGKLSNVLDGSLTFMVDLWVRINGVSNITCQLPDLIDFGSGSSPDPSILIQDNTGELGWYFSKADTPAPLTGPGFDHTTGNGTGYFIFFNAQYDVRKPKIGNRARLLTPWFPATNSCSLNLYIHMWDGTPAPTKMGSFQIDVRGTNGAWEQVLWIKGNQNNMWHEKNVFLKRNIKTYEDIQVRFTAIRGHTSQSDIAMDDLRFSAGCGLNNYEVCSNNINNIIGTSSQKGPFLFVNRGTLVGGLTKRLNVSSHVASFMYGAWNHVAISFQNATKQLSIYLNGQEVGSKTLQNVPNWTSNDLFFGREEDKYMKGFIDEIHIWSSIKNITSLYQKPSSPTSRDLLASYSLNEGEGTLANDVTGQQSPASVSSPDWVRSFNPNR